jgi:alpha-glucosidase
MTEVEWWKRGVIYQIYPRSFQDSNGDGIGDLAGIGRRLDHLVALGVDAVWLSPIFLSPMKDFGYDVADYRAIDPIFGTLEDFDGLLAAVHDRGLKLLLDLVPNHTSDQSEWFLESRSSKDAAKRDWYIWRDPAPDGGPPNNWLSEFGGSAWEYDAATGQYYYHAFLAAQPDLNWRNPAVREAVYGAMRYWLERGVDGFRVDVMWHLVKDDQFRDNPVDPNWKDGDAPTRRLVQLYTADQSEVQEIVREMRAVINAFPERVLIGEIYLPVERLVRYYGEKLDGAHLPFNFALIDAPWHARDIDRIVTAYEGSLPDGGWPNWVLGNHDKPRVATRVGPAQAPVAAMLLLTLRGTPTIYYGDEIGMEQVAIGGADVQDPFERNVPGFGFGRDGARTPMPWDKSPNGGFTDGTPWLPLGLDHAIRNVAAAAEDPDSLLALHRRLIGCRRAHPALSIGRYLHLDAEGDLLTYARTHGDESFLVALALSGEPQRVTLEAGLGGEIVVATDRSLEGTRIDGIVDLDGNQGVVVRLDRSLGLGE